MNKIKALLILLVLTIAATASAQETKEKTPSVQATGEAVVTAKPDRAQIDIGVVTQAATSQAAVAENARKLDATAKQLRELVSADTEIKTISYTVSPNYRYPKEGGEPEITGYTATNILRVTLDDLTIIGKVIDETTRSGANRVQNLQFTLKDEQAAQLQALREATVKAKRKAEALAFALGLKIDRVVSVVESSPNVIPVREMAMARADAASTPIEPGTIEVRASVTLTAEVSR